MDSNTWDEKKFQNSPRTLEKQRKEPSAWLTGSDSTVIYFMGGETDPFVTTQMGKASLPPRDWSGAWGLLSTECLDSICESDNIIIMIIIIIIIIQPCCSFTSI